MAWAQGHPTALLQDLEEERQIYRSLHSLTRDQLAAIEEEDLSRLVSLLRQRQQILLTLQDRAPEPVPAPLSWTDEAEAATLQAEIKDLLQEILSMDEEARRRLQVQREEVQETLTQIQKGRSALSGYRQAVESAPAIYDGRE